MRHNVLYISFFLATSLSSPKPFDLSFDGAKPEIEKQIVIPKSEVVKRLNIEYNLVADDNGSTTPPKPTGT
jgi:hypothetical protein